MEHLCLLHVSTSARGRADGILRYHGLRLQVHVPMHARIVEGWCWSHVTHVLWSHGPDHVRILKRQRGKCFTFTYITHTECICSSSVCFTFRLASLQFPPTLSKATFYCFKLEGFPSDNTNPHLFLLMGKTNTAAGSTQWLSVLLFFDLYVETSQLNFNDFLDNACQL